MLPCAITRRVRMSMLVLRKLGEDQFSEGSEAVVLLTVLLTGVPLGVV